MHRTDPIATALLDAARQVAYARLAGWPQYRGYFDGPEWGLAQITRRIDTKAGLQAEPGDVVIARRDTIQDPANTRELKGITFWTPRTGHLVALEWGACPVNWIVEPGEPTE